VAGIIGIPGRLQSVQAAAFARNPRPTSSECAGKRIERREVGPPGAFEALTDDELERALLERFNALG
jgi:hypothetical protein